MKEQKLMALTLVLQTIDNQLNDAPSYVRKAYLMYRRVHIKNKIKKLESQLKMKEQHFSIKINLN